VQYYVKGDRQATFFTDNEVVLALTRPERSSVSSLKKENDGFSSPHGKTLSVDANCPSL
jgi:hypothetical protein